MPGRWHHIQEIRDSVRTLLEEHAEDLRNSVVVAISELLENAVKYGVEVPRLPEVEVEINIFGDTVSIRVSNGIDSQDNPLKLREHIAWIKQAADPRDMYLKRLKELRKKRDGSVGLGIYRIAAEGGFTIDAEVSDDVVVVTAERAVASRG